MKTLELDIEYLLSNQTFIPTLPKYGEESKKIDVREVVQALTYSMNALKKENLELRSDLKNCILNASQLDWNREIKRKLLEKYFPEEIANQPYYNGGERTTTTSQKGIEK